MKILLIEDDSKTADFVRSGLIHAGHMVTHAADGDSGYKKAKEEFFDVAIIDLMLPIKDGFSILEDLRSDNIYLPILILSAKRDVTDRVKGLKMGGDDYLTKPFALAELIARVEAIGRRNRKLSIDTELSIADLRINSETRKVYRGDSEIDLQPREFELLRFLMENSGKVISKTMIISQVWNYNFDPQTNIVEARICKLREKIDGEGLVKLIHTIRGVGYVIRENL